MEMTEPSSFASPEALLDAALEMLEARRARCEAEKSKEVERLRETSAKDRLLSRRWHRCVRGTGRNMAFSALCATKRLNRVERELLIVLVLERLALTTAKLESCAEVVAMLGLGGARSLSALRALGEGGRLYRRGLIEYADTNEDLRDRCVYPDPAILDSFDRSRPHRTIGWPVRSERGLLERLSTVTVALNVLAEAHDDERRGYGNRRSSRRALRRVDLLVREVEQTLSVHRDWKLAALFSRRQRLARAERLILLALAGKQLGHLHGESDLFRGGGLARAASRDAASLLPQLRLLLASGRLRRARLVQPCDESDALLAENEYTVDAVEFELTRDALGLLGLGVRSRCARSMRFRPRKPLVALDQVVLPERADTAVRMALVHARHGRTLLEEWGFENVLAYGRTVAVLLSGAPGVGKTACAEAIAHELGRDILVADYSRLQDCYVGQTEKNIVRIFREARASDAVLFWDEADAMFGDREKARQPWEVRDVNVLLQELERFEGVCILATNRKIALDSALSRRVAIKIELERPDRPLRLRIWERLLPRALPLDPAVRMDRLAEARLTGGEIKNVIVNAARLALMRGTRTRVTMDDFERALRQERESRWGERSGRSLGFRATDR